VLRYVVVAAAAAAELLNPAAGCFVCVRQCLLSVFLTLLETIVLLKFLFISHSLLRLADSSPQGSFNWLLSLCFNIRACNIMEMSKALNSLIATAAEDHFNRANIDCTSPEVVQQLGQKRFRD
jgi:hypothetical protein